MTTISIMSGAIDLSASPVAQAVSEYTFQSYRIGVIVIGLALVALAWAGLGASTVARIICVVVGALFVGNGLYLFLFADRHTLWELYPFAFILPFLVVGRDLTRALVVLLGVKERYRRRNIYFVLLHELLSRALAYGATGADASWILEDNEPMLSFFREAGIPPNRRWRIYEKAIPGA